MSEIEKILSNGGSIQDSDSASCKEYIGCPHGRCGTAVCTKVRKRTAEVMDLHFNHLRRSMSRARAKEL